MPPCEGGYKNFKIGELFEIPQCSKKVSKKDAVIDGVIPIYSSDTTNNGIVGYCNNTPHWRVSDTTPHYLIFGDHTRAFHIATSDFCVADNVKVLIPKYPEMSIRVLLYLIAIWHKGIPNIGYARHWSLAKNVIISLPVTSTGKINFSFIESRIRELEEERIRELEAYLAAAGFANCTLTPEEQGALRKFNDHQVNYKVRKITDTFQVTNTHNILKQDVIFGSGSTPYVTASESNNSIVSRISYKNEMIEKGEAIMIGGKTLVVTYQSEDFFSNDSHNLRLSLKDSTKHNENIYLYLVGALCKSLKPKYSWGNSISKAKIQSDTLSLPITTDGKIDYPFMETFISAIKKQTIAALKDYIAREHHAYEQVINP